MVNLSPTWFASRGCFFMWGKPGEVTPFVSGVVVYELGFLRLQGNKMLVIKNHKNAINHTNIFSCVQSYQFHILVYLCFYAFYQAGILFSLPLSADFSSFYILALAGILFSMSFSFPTPSDGFLCVSFLNIQEKGSGSFNILLSNNSLPTPVSTEFSSRILQVSMAA